MRGPDWLCAALATVLTWVVFSPYALVAVDFHHDGNVAKPALDVAAGQIPFRDTIVVYGTLSTWLQAEALHWFGPTLVTLRYTGLIAYALIGGVLAAAWSCLLPRPLLLVAIAFWLAAEPFRIFPMVPWPSVYWLLFHALAMLAVLAAVREPRRMHWAVLAGVLAGLAFCARHLPIGIITVVGTIGGFILLAFAGPSARRDAWRLAAGATAGAAAVVGVLLVMLAMQGTLGGWFRYTFVFALELHQLHDQGLAAGLMTFDLHWLPGLALAGAWVAMAAAAVWLGSRRSMLAALPIVLGALVLAAVPHTELTRALWGVWPIGLVAVAVGTALVLARARPLTDALVQGRLAVLPLCLGAWVHSYPIGDPLHAYWALAPSYGLVVLGAWEWLGRRTNLAAAALLAVLLPWAIQFVPTEVERLRDQSFVELRRPPILAGMWTAPEHAAEISRIADALNRYDQERPRWPMMLEAGTLPLLLTFAPDLSNPQPMSFVFDGIGYDAQARARFVFERRPLIVLPRDGQTSEPVRHAMATLGYRSLFSYKWAHLLVPEAGPP